MDINEEIIEVLKEYSIKKDDGICYLLSLFYGYKPSYIPNELKIKVNITKIVVDKGGNLHWNVPLFDGQETTFDWVEKEYIEMFHNKNPKKGRYKRECIGRMKKLFAKDPSIRKEEVIGATVLYLSETDPTYIRKPHFFIEKGVGVNKIQDILDWIDRYREAQEPEEEGRNVSRRLQ